MLWGRDKRPDKSPARPPLTEAGARAMSTSVPARQPGDARGWTRGSRARGPDGGSLEHQAKGPAHGQGSREGRPAVRIALWSGGGLRTWEGGAHMPTPHTHPRPRYTHLLAREKSSLLSSQEQSQRVSTPPRPKPQYKTTGPASNQGCCPATPQHAWPLTRQQEIIPEAHGTHPKSAAPSGQLVQAATSFSSRILGRKPTVPIHLATPFSVLGHQHAPLSRRRGVVPAQAPHRGWGPRQHQAGAGTASALLRPGRGPGAGGLRLAESPLKGNRAKGISVRPEAASAPPGPSTASSR